MANLDAKKRKTTLTQYGPTNTGSFPSQSTFQQSGINNRFDMEEWKKQVEIKINKLDDEEIEFDLIGIDPALANALRRILISEIPTMAIETVYFKNNTSIIADEILAHRLGLIPIRVDEETFANLGYQNEGEDHSDRNTLVFEIDVTCTPRTDIAALQELAKEKNLDSIEKLSPYERYHHAAVYSSDIKWIPQGDQNTEAFPIKEVAPAFPGILIAKLRPGQSIQATLHAKMGIGKHHAKFSPSIAFYRLLPEISLKKEVINADASRLVNLCPTKVFDIEDLGNNKQRAVVARPRNCTTCRECIREPFGEERVKLEKVKDHFIFSIEAIGQRKPEVLFTEALKILMARCHMNNLYLEQSLTNNE